MTALAFYGLTGRYLIAAIGPSILVFEGSLRISRSPILFNEQIHGIRVQGDRILVFGGCSFALTIWEKLIDSEPLTEEFKCHHRILDSIFLDSQRLAFLTAWNEVHIFNGSTLERKFSSSKRSLLYCGKLWLKSNQIHVAGGTIINGIELWDTKVTEKSLVVNPSIEIHGHEGSIFDIDVHVDKALIASVSDDRTIRLFKMDGSLVGIGYGHDARVWRVLFSQEGEIFSAGEDAVCQVWHSIPSPSTSQSRLEVRNSFKGHIGKSIWSMAYNQDNNCLASGGNDGSIYIWPLSKDDCMLLPKRVGDSMAKLVHFLTESLLAIVTMDNAVYQIDIFSKASSLLFRAREEITSVSGSNSFICCGLSSGSMAVFKDGKLTFMPIHTDKIVFLQYFGNDFIFSGTFKLEYKLTKQEESEKVSLAPYFRAKCATMSSSGLVIVGGKTGSLAAYANGRSAKWDNVHPNGVSDLLILDEPGGNLIRVASCGRDGVVNISSIDPKEMVLTTEKRIALCKGKLHGLFLYEQDLFAYGLSSELFSIFKVKTGICIASEKIPLHNQIISSVHNVKKKFTCGLSYGPEIRIIQQSFSYSKNALCLLPALHGREIKAIAVHPSRQYIATGGEDTSIVISRIMDDMKLNRLCRLRGHITGLHSLEWFPKGDVLLSTGGRGEYLFWRMVDESLIQMDFSKYPEFAGDVRITDCSVLETGPNEYLVGLSFSDSSVKLLSVNVDTTRIDVVSDRVYSHFCITQVSLFRNKSGVFLVSAANDGNILVFNASLSDYKVLRAHQSKINMILINKNGECLDIFTVGDDGAIAISRMEGSQEDIILNRVGLYPDAHTGSATGVTRVVTGSGEYLVTIGTEQLIKVWERRGDYELSKVAEFYTHVADASGICLLNSSIISYGMGISIDQIPEKIGLVI